MAEPSDFQDASAFTSLADLVLALADQFPGAMSLEVATNVRRQLDEKMQDTADYTFDLMRRRAGGFGDPTAALSAKQRMTSPRYVTTPPGERRRIIAKNAIDIAHELTQHLPKAIEAALCLKLLQFELAQEDRRAEAVRQARQIKVDTDLYQSVKRVSDLLYTKFGITYQDWDNLADTDVDAIAAILLGGREDNAHNVSRDHKPHEATDPPPWFPLVGG